MTVYLGSRPNHSTCCAVVNFVASLEPGILLFTAQCFVVVNLASLDTSPTMFWISESTFLRLGCSYKTYTWSRYMFWFRVYMKIYVNILKIDQLCGTSQSSTRGYYLPRRTLLFSDLLNSPHLYCYLEMGY